MALFPQQQPIPCLAGGEGKGRGHLLPSFALPPLFLLSTQWRSINKSCSCVQTLPMVSRGPSYSRLYASTHLASNNVLTFQLISSHPLLWRLCVFPLPSPPHAWRARLAQVHPASHGIQTTWLPGDLSGQLKKSDDCILSSGFSHCYCGTLFPAVYTLAEPKSSFLSLKLLFCPLPTNVAKLMHKSYTKI